MENNNTSNVYDISKAKKAKRKLTPAERRKRKRIVRVTVFFAICLAVLSGLVILISQLLFNVSTITVTYTNAADSSKRYYTDEEIIANSTIEKGDGLLFVFSSKVSEELQTKLPYISAVTVKKDLPSGIIIEITECAKVYCFETSSGYYLTDETGKLIEKTTETSKSKYTTIKYKTITAEVIGEKVVLGNDTDKIYEYLALVRKAGINITSADFTNMDNVYMNYDNRISIHIGKMSDEKKGVTAWSKLQLAKKSLEAEDKINPEQRGTLNMTIAKKAYFKAETEMPD